MTELNRRVLLKQRPTGVPTTECFELTDGKIPDVGPEEALVRTLWLSIDAGMINRLRDEDNYAAGVQVGDCMQGSGIGQVIRSRHSKFKEGDIIRFAPGWQEYSIVGEKNPVDYIDPAIAPITHQLGYLGNSGFAAYIGVMEILRPRAGMTMVVSSAAGGVGSIAGQVARILGCNVVGIVGDQDKCGYVVDKLRFDACVSYRSADFAQALARAVPTGIDLYFDNVGGTVAESLLSLYNPLGRIAICGRVGLSHLTDTRQDIGLRDHNTMLVKRLTKQGFLVFDYPGLRKEAVTALFKWYREGLLIIDESISEGISAMPEALVEVLSGKNNGKKLVRLADPV